ncbi:hypothetical protein [Sphingomonas kyungheensis]|uniref:Uncharacterized protein n=1 Tax=Sphingomonas kyungheensis TaxID=1069987 RepID=A0ABU8H5Y1_9SPHN
MADPLKERISLLEMGEAQGKLQPQHAAELARYRASGATKSTAAPAPTSPNAAPSRPAPVTLDAPATVPKGQAAQAAYAKVAALRSMKKQLNRVHELYDRNMSDSGASGLKEFNPFRAANQEFDGAVAGVPMLARQAFRVAGSGSDSDAELKLITDALPNRWSFDGTNKERFRTLDSLMADMIGNNAGLAGYSREQAAALRAENPYRPAGKPPLPKAPPRTSRPQGGRVVLDINGNPVR